MRQLDVRSRSAHQAFRQDDSHRYEIASLVFVGLGVGVIAVTQSWKMALLAGAPLGFLAILMLVPSALVRPRQALTVAVTAFLVWGSLYPAIRVELLSRTTLSSAMLGAWQDGLWIVTLALLPLAGVPRVNLPTACWIGILFWGAISAFQAPDVGTAAYGFRLTYYPMLYYAVGQALMRDTGAGRRLHLGLAIHTTACVIIACLLSYAARDYWIGLVVSNSAERGWGLSAIAREGGLRMTGTFLDPTAFGLFCAIGTVLSLSAFLYPLSAVARAMLMLSTLICAFGTLFSLSRGAWVLLTIGLITLALLYRRLGQILAAATIVTVVSVLAFGSRVGLPEAEVIANTWTKTLSEGNSQRESSWRETVDAVRANPFGFGLGTVGHVGERFRAGDRAPEITDGWYLKVLAEGGVPLLLAFLLFQLVAAVTMLRHLLKAPQSPSAPLRAAALATLLGTAVQAIASNTWDLFFLSQVLWLLAGAALAPVPPSIAPHRAARTAR